MGKIKPLHKIKKQKYNPKPPHSDRSNAHIELSKELDRLLNLIFPKGKPFVRVTAINHLKMGVTQLRLLKKRAEQIEMPESDRKAIINAINMKLQPLENQLKKLGE